jgi:spore coat protein U-like protein
VREAAHVSNTLYSTFMDALKDGIRQINQNQNETIPYDLYNFFVNTLLWVNNNNIAMYLYHHKL